MSDELLQKGQEIRRSVLGDEYVNRATALAPDAFGADFQKLVGEYCWGACWGRDGVERKTRSLLVVSILGTLGRMEEFALHFRAAFVNNDCTLEELEDALFHVAVYAGIPAGVEAFRVARRVIAEEQAKAEGGTA